MALVGKTLRYVVETPFMQLSRTPGIGAKKLGSLIMLMSRAAESSGTNGHAHVQEPAGDGATGDPSAVSEALWSQWGPDLRSRGLGQELLGRFPPSLRDLPRCMWRKRLDDYLSLSLAEIHQLRGHGEKRVAAMVEIVGGLHKITERLAVQAHVTVRIEPRLEAMLEGWFAGFLPADPEQPGEARPAGACGLPDDSSVCANLLEPLIEQARIDLGDQAAAVLRHRLFQPRLSVQRTALEVGLTRGRVYEIVAEASQALDIRWPRGWRRLLELRSELADAVAAGGAYRESLSRVEVTISLLFRDRRPGSSALGESE